MSASDRYNTGPDDLVTKLSNLEARIGALERNPRLSNATIDTGKLTVKDNTGDPRVELGLLDDGTYGLSVKENMQDQFHQVPYIYAASVITQETCTNSSFSNLTTLGPLVSVPVRSSGRILIIITSQIQWQSPAFSAATVGGGYVTIDMAGANTMSATVAFDKILASSLLNVSVSAGTSAEFALAMSTGSGVIEGLNPGLTTITMRYAMQAGATSTDFGKRNLTVVTL